MKVRPELSPGMGNRAFVVRPLYLIFPTLNLLKVISCLVQLHSPGPKEFTSLVFLGQSSSAICWQHEGSRVDGERSASPFFVNAYNLIKG